MGKEEQKELTAIFKESLKTSLRLNAFLACIAITLLGVYLENMRKDLILLRTSDIKIEKSITKLEFGQDHLKAEFINLEGRVGRIEDRWD